MKKLICFLTCLLAFVLISQSLNAQPRKVDFSNYDNLLRGWSWDGKIASYIAKYGDGSTSYLFVRPFDGSSLNKPLSRDPIFMSKSDGVKGWNWDGTTASYFGVEGGKTYLFIRKFDGENLDPNIEQKIFMSKNADTQNLRGWTWDGTTARYIGVEGGTTYLFTRKFDGKDLDPDFEKMEISPFIRGLNVRGGKTSYGLVKNGKTKITIQPYELKPYNPMSVWIGEEESDATVTKGAMQTTSDGDKYVEYTVHNIPSLSMSDDAKLNIKLHPKASVKDGNLYVHISTESSSIDFDMSKYINKEDFQGPYLHAVNTSFTITNPTDKFELDRWGPTNLNETGQYTDMQSFSIGTSGTTPGLSFSMGSSYTKEVKDFDFVNSKTDDGNSPIFSWALNPGTFGVGPMKMIHVKYPGVYAAPPPVIARSSFPVYSQALFKAKYPDNPIPDYIQITCVVDTRINSSKLTGRGYAQYPQWVHYPNVTYKAVTILLDLRDLKKS